MNRRSFVLAAGALAIPAWAKERYERGLLWRITKDGKTNHVFGTIHDADMRVAVPPAPAEGVFGRSRTLLVEFLPDAYSRERFTEAALFTDRQTLEEKIGADDFARVLEQLAPSGLERDVIGKLKPWGALINLRHSAADAAESLDARLVGQARGRRLAVFQMEGVEEQIFAFDECPMETQVALLKHTLSHRDELMALEDETIRAYLARDLSAIWRLREGFIARYPEVAAHQAVMTKRLLYDRSVVMAYRMQRELRRGGAFVAVGALHLYGERGVLALLQEDGYRAARVY
ncbi:MAG TPA: TraB/GumN family protein [Burkholderiales bacterium]|nr:TraB/GumN family protein [Burkholderiales bacterium]